MRNHNQIHTLGAPHGKAHFGPKNTVTAHAKTCERMLRHRAVYGGNCGMV